LPQKTPTARLAGARAATLVDEPPSGDDSSTRSSSTVYRVLARLGAGDATLHTRSGKDWTARMPTRALV